MVSFPPVTLTLAKAEPALVANTTVEAAATTRIALRILATSNIFITYHSFSIVLYALFLNLRKRIPSLAGHRPDSNYGFGFCMSCKVTPPISDKNNPKRNTCKVLIDEPAGKKAPPTAFTEAATIFEGVD